MLKTLATAATILLSNPGDTITTKQATTQPITQEITNILAENSEFQTLVKAISQIKNEDDLPLVINYNKENPELPELLNVKRNRDKPKYFYIQLDTRIFQLEPMIGEISELKVENGGVTLDVEIKILPDINKTIDSQRLAELVQQLSNHTGNGSIQGMKGVTGREVTKILNEQIKS